jgi:hypothetical protein
LIIIVELLSEELDFKASFALEIFATVFQTEVYALLACSDYCLRECMTGKTICICSGSQAALLALRLVLQCRNSLQGLSIHTGVQLLGVIIGNEEADGLTGVGSKSNFCGPEPCLPIPKSLMTRVTKK